MSTVLADAAPFAPPASQPAPPIRASRRERLALGGLVVLYLISAIGFALVTPYGETPDEYAHMAYIDYIISRSALPPIRKNLATYEAQQPPLYYFLGATVILVGRGIVGERQWRC